MFTNSSKGIGWNQKRSSEGFSLVETLVALAVSMIIVIGMTQVFISGIRHMQTVRADTRVAANAAYLAQTVGREVQRAEVIQNVTGSPSVTLTRPDGSVRTIALDGETAKVESEAVTTTEVRVTSLEFTKVGESLRMEFIIEPLRPGRPFEGQITFTSLTGRLPS